MAKPTPLEEYIGTVRQADQKDDAAFQTVVARGMELMQLLDSDLSHQFGVSRPTVNRWRTGANAPHPALRKHVFAWLRHRAALLSREKVPA
jgi:hypothetical protein